MDFEWEWPSIAARSLSNDLDLVPGVHELAREKV
jgi:hypothetical protein